MIRRYVSTIPIRELFGKAKDTLIDKAIQQFLQVYRVTPFSMMPAEAMFARIIKSVFDKLLLKQLKPGHTK